MDYTDIGFVLRGALAQVILFSLVPVIWWAVSARKKEKLHKWLGFIFPKAEKKPAVISLAVYVVVSVLLHLPVFSQITQPSASHFTGMGAKALLPAFIISFFQNAFAEELLFRGFLNKRFRSKMSLQGANILQAAIFGAMHIVFAAATEVNLLSAAVMFTTTFIGGYMLGYLSEKIFSGSILPAVILHGCGNFITHLIAAYTN